MRSIKDHMALTISLFAILFCIESLLVLDRIVKSYENDLKENYSLILVADRSVKVSDISHIDTLIGSVEPIDAESILKEIEGRMSEESLSKIRQIMPLFFSLKLRRYADRERIEKLKSELLSVAGVKEVHIFEKVHDRLYSMLLFIKSTLTLFGLLAGVVSILLLMKQMTIWQFEHKERMQIMSLFGAPVWLRSGVLFRLAVVDAFLAFAAVVSTMLYLSSNSEAIEFLQSIGADPDLLFRYDDIAVLAAVSFGVSLTCAAWVVARFKEEQ